MSDLKDLDRAIDRLVNNGKIDQPSELTQTAAVLRRLSSVRPDERRRAELKRRYLAYGRELAESQSTKQAMPVPRRWTFTRRVAVVVMALLIPSGGVVYAATGSMPDSPLYPIKRATESIALSVTPGSTRAQLETVFAKNRVLEAQYLLKQTDKNRSQALKLLIEARAAGERGLKNQVDELLERVGAKNKAKGDKIGKPAKEQEKSNTNKPETPKPETVDDQPSQSANPKATGSKANPKASSKASSGRGKP